MGFGNDNYVVKTTKGKYVLRIYRDVRKISELRYEVEFTDHLLAKGFPYEIPKWLPNKSGELISTFNGRMYIIYKYLPGIVVEKPTNAQVRQVAKMISILHKMSVGFKPKSDKDWGNAFTTHWQKAELNDYAPRAKKQNTTRSKLLLKNEMYYRRLLDDVDKKYAKVSYKRYVLHNDLNKHNMLFRNGKLSGLIDFDNVNADYLIKDISQYVLYGLNQGSKIDLRKARIFIKEYQKYHSLSDKEIKCIPDIAIIGKIGAFVWTYDRMERGISKVDLKGMRQMAAFVKWVDVNRDKIMEALL